MSNTTTTTKDSENLPIRSEFQIMDDADARQIEEADTTIKAALVYDLKGKKQISYMGIKWLVLKMSQTGQPLEIVDMPIVSLERYDPENQSTWIWYATTKVRNIKTGLVTIGASEQSYIQQFGNGQTQYDVFGRTKAMSKAERNAYRKQIPETELQIMLNETAKENTQNIGVQTDRCNCPPVERKPSVDCKACTKCNKLLTDGIRKFLESKKAEAKNTQANDASKSNSADAKSFHGKTMNCICAEENRQISANNEKCNNCDRLLPIRLVRDLKLKAKAEMREKERLQQTPMINA